MPPSAATSTRQILRRPSFHAKGLRVGSNRQTFTQQDSPLALSGALLRSRAWVCGKGTGMRIRTIKPEFWLHEGLVELSPLHRLLFIGLWQLADKEGRMDDRPSRIKAALFPYEDHDIDRLMFDLDERGFIRRYESSGSTYVAIPGFRQHQRPHPKEADSEIPPPDANGARTKSLERAERVYFIRDVRTGLVKIGRSVVVAQRMKELQTGNPGGLELLCETAGGFQLESSLHLELSAHRKVGEWFKPTPEVMAAVKRYAPAVERLDPAVSGLAIIPSSPVGREGKGMDNGKGMDSAGKPAGPEKSSSPRHQPLVEALCDAYKAEMLGAKYDFTPRDGKNVQLLLAKSPDNEEIVFRWRTALVKSQDQYQSPKTRDLTDFVRDWNAYPVVKDGQRHGVRL